MSHAEKPLPEQVVSLFPPTVIDTSDGRFAVYGSSGWFRVDDSFTLEDAIKRWVPWQSTVTQSESESTENEWNVVSDRDPNLIYKVSRSGDEWECQCVGWKFHKKDCKHIKKIKAEKGVL